MINDDLVITYRTCYRERWRIGEDFNRSERIGPPIRPNRLYEPEIGQDSTDRHGHHLILPPRELMAGGRLDRALAFQRLVKALMTNGYRREHHPLALYQDLEAVRTTDPYVSFDYRNNIVRYNVRQPGKLLIEHFLDLAGYEHLPSQNVSLPIGFTRPRRLTSAIRRLWSHKRRITTANVGRAMRAGPVVPGPLPYAAIMRRTGFVGVALDVHPALGYKALACLNAGAAYVAWQPTDLVTSLVEFGGVRAGVGHPDLVIADGCLRKDWAPPDQEPAWYAPVGGARPALWLFVPSRALSQEPPSWVVGRRWRLQILTHGLQSSPDQLWIYGS